MISHCKFNMIYIWLYNNVNYLKLKSVCTMYPIKMLLKCNTAKHLQNTLEGTTLSS